MNKLKNVNWGMLGVFVMTALIWTIIISYPLWSLITIISIVGIASATIYYLNNYFWK